MIHNFSSISDLDLKNRTEREVLSAWFRLARKNQMAIALWKLPWKSAKHLVIDISGTHDSCKVDLEETDAGFLIAPFDNPERSQEILLKAHIYYCSGQIKAANEVNSRELDKLLSKLNKELQSPKSDAYYYRANGDPGDTSYREYISMVESALLAIAKGELQKVVPAVLRKVPLTRFNCLDSFDKLCNCYPEAFISLVSAPGIGTWMGASPEAIIEVEKSKTFTTVAVAGTQAHQPGIPLQDVAWRQKEIEEQALVSRYIINCFKKIRLREFEETGPKTVIAGNLLHLKTTYTVDMEETNFPLLGSVMLDLLHPTSAVCGMLKIPSQQFLKDYEGFDRQLFSGYLGPVNMHNETHLFVNLRCMQLQENHAVLYAGAGVTEDSLPEKEWLETQLKCDTLLDVLDL